MSNMSYYRVIREARSVNRSITSKQDNTSQKPPQNPRGTVNSSVAESPANIQKGRQSQKSKFYN